MLDDRKASILRAVVEEYIRTAQPVGSGHVVRSSGVQVSSATVRNEMAHLEEEGFLAQPHTSAGRIPTDKGYRWFVDSLSGPARLDRSKAQRVRDYFDHAHGELERMLLDTTRLLSDVTAHTALVVGPPPEMAVVRSFQLVGLSPRLVLVVVVLSNGAVEKRTLELTEDWGEDALAVVSARLASHLHGQRPGAAGPLPSMGDAAADALADAALRLIDPHEEPGEVFVGGAAQVASGFQVAETVREVLGFLEQQLVVVTLLRDVLDRGLSVAIGSETGVAPLVECSLVVAPYEVDGEPAGTVGVLGPTRMDYPQALAAVAVVSQRLSERLSEG